MRQDTRKLLKAGSWIFGIGILCVALLFGAFGGATRQGPHTNGGWLMLIFALGCLPVRPHDPLPRRRQADRRQEAASRSRFLRVLCGRFHTVALGFQSLPLCYPSP